MKKKTEQLNSIHEDDEIVRIKASLKPGFDASKYFVTEYSMGDFLDAVAKDLQNKKPIRRGIPWKNIFRRKSR